MVQAGESETPSQVFLTDARPERTRQFLAHLPGPRRYFTIENGKVAEK